jgi:hypothetical protein
LYSEILASVSAGKASAFFGLLHFITAPLVKERCNFAFVSGGPTRGTGSFAQLAADCVQFADDLTVGFLLATTGSEAETCPEDYYVDWLVHFDFETKDGL